MKVRGREGKGGIMKDEEKRERKRKGKLEEKGKVKRRVGLG